MKSKNRIALALLSGVLLLTGSCGGGGGGSSFRSLPVIGDYADLLAVSRDNVIVPGDIISETNNWGAYYFVLAGNVSSVRVSITGAGGSQGGAFGGGTGGTGEFDLTPTYLASEGFSGFWIVVGEAGRPSAGETGPITDFMAYNGGGAATDWSDGENTYVFAGGGGGSSDVRLAFAGDPSDPQFPIDPCAAPSSRFAVVGGGGGGTDNTNAFGGFGGGFNRVGGDGAYEPDLFGLGGTLSAGGALGGTLCYGGNGLQDDTEGWAGGGGGGYYGGGAAPAHGGGGGGSGFLALAPGIFPVGTLDGTQGTNLTTTLHGAFTITVN
jgi:hypothetical protein